MADPYAAPGELLLRTDIQLLHDAGVLNVPINAWPISYSDIDRAISMSDLGDLSEPVVAALQRVRERISWESAADSLRFDFGASAAENPRFIRSFENTPRESGELFARLNWLGERLAVNLQVTGAADPFDDDEVRFDGTYVGLVLGNWMISAGWQERWWGPGNGGSLILGTNARPSPGITFQRNNSTPFETKWLSWIGPWSFTTFFDLLDDEREVDDAILFGARFSIQPLDGLEVGVSRVGQLCGDGRICDLESFYNFLVGNDNRGLNIDIDDEPGNQLAGIDIRWRLPRKVPIAIYMQWIGEDTRSGKPLPGSWLRQAGAEFWGEIGGMSQRSYFEVSDTICRLGGFGFSESKVNCAYNHGVFQSGYRFNGRVIGHGIDGDGRSFSAGSTLVQSSGHSWNVLLRHMEINRVGPDNMRHSISSGPSEITDIQISHDRTSAFGTIKIAVGYSRTEDVALTESENDVSAFVQWSSR